MYCVIQEIEIKRIPAGEPKEIIVTETNWSINGEARTTYGYTYSNERYERNINKAYRIGVHESYRENGKVKKRQYCICTIGYYDVVDWGDWIGDYINGSRWKEKLREIGIPEEELTDLIYKKWQPIADGIRQEYELTEEYRAREEHQRIIKEYHNRESEFAKKYDVECKEYNYCYDVFGTLRNPEYLEKIKKEYKARKEYERKSREESSSYYEKYYSNYNTGGMGSGYAGTFQSNYDTEEKDMLKQFYRVLSKKYHPDMNPDKDTSKEMQLLNQLKGSWGI